VESEDLPTTISAASMAARIRELDAGILVALHAVNQLDRIIERLALTGKLTEAQASALGTWVGATILALDRIDPVNTPEEVYEDGALR